MLLVTLLLVAALFAVLALWRIGRGPIARAPDWAIAAALILVGLLLWRGNPLLAVAAIGLGGWALWPRLRAPPTDEAIIAARALLGVGADADQRAIRAAWRKAMARAHPDVGGTAAAAQRLTQARDLLLRVAQQRAPTRREG